MKKVRIFSRIGPQVIDPSPEPAGMTSFLAVSLPPDSCPDKTGEFLSVPVGSRNIRQESGGKEPVKNRSETVGSGQNRRDPTQKSPEPCRLLEVPATGLIDLGACFILSYWPTNDSICR
jgi:hypothetical protein